MSVYPAVLDLTAVKESQLSSSRSFGLYRGDTFELSFQVQDLNGDPFDAGVHGSANWTLAAEFRSGKRYESDVLATAVVSWVDAPTGMAVLVLAAGLTSLDTFEGMWDVQMTNVSDSAYTVGYVVTPVYGVWRMNGDVTE